MPGLVAVDINGFSGVNGNVTSYLLVREVHTKEYVRLKKSKPESRHRFLC